MDNKEIETATFWKKLDEELNNTYTFPTEYVFKFIVENDIVKTTALKDIFANANASITHRESSNKTYTSYTITAIFNSSIDIINYYKKAGEIEGIKSL